MPIQTSEGTAIANPNDKTVRLMDPLNPQNLMDPHALGAEDVRRVEVPAGIAIPSRMYGRDSETSPYSEEEKAALELLKDTPQDKLRELRLSEGSLGDAKQSATPTQIMAMTPAPPIGNIAISAPVPADELVTVTTTTTQPAATAPAPTTTTVEPAAPPPPPPSGTTGSGSTP